MSVFDSPFKNLRSSSANESSDDDLFGDIGEGERDQDNAGEGSAFDDAYKPLGDALGSVTGNGSEEHGEPEGDDEGEGDGFEGATSEPVEVTVSVDTEEPVPAEHGEDVAQAARDVEELGEHTVAVESYRAIIKHYGLTPGIGEAIRLGMESIHPSLGRTNVVPSLESISSEEPGVVSAADRSLEQTTQRLKETQDKAIDALEDAVCKQAESTKAFAAEHAEKLEQLESRLHNVDTTAVATLNIKDTTMLNADDVLVATDPRYQDALEDTLKDVRDNVLTHVPAFITRVAEVMRSVKDHESLTAFGEALAKVGASYPSIEGRTGSVNCPLDYEVPAIRTNTLLGEAWLLQYRGERVCGNTFRDLLNSFHYTYNVTFSNQGQDPAPTETVAVPQVHELNELIEYLGKSCDNVTRLIDVDLFKNIVNEANVSVANTALDDVGQTQHAELINGIVSDTAELIGKLGAHATRVIASSVAFLSECTSALEEATARLKAEEQVED